MPPDAGRLVEIKGWSEGSGFLIADDLILTAWHLLRPPPGQSPKTKVIVRLEMDIKEGESVNLANQDADVIWPSEDPGDDSDFALLAIRPGRPPVKPIRHVEPIEWAAPGTWGELNVTVVGYPDCAINREIGRRDTRGIRGWINLSSSLRSLKERRGTLTIRLRNEDAPKLPATMAWSAMSGAAVFAGSVLIGMVRLARGDERTHQLDAISVDRLFDDPNIVSIIKSKGLNSPFRRERYHEGSTDSSRFAAANASHHASTKSKATRNDWWSHPIPIKLADSKGIETDSRELLTKWIDKAEEQHCVILGEPGCGKSGILSWLAYTICDNTNAVVLQVQARRLNELKRIDFSALQQLSEPKISVEASLTDIEPGNFYILLDGIDELVGTAFRGTEKAIPILEAVLQTLPPSVRVVAACRPPAFAVLRENFHRSLPDNGGSGRSDHYKIAIASALGIKHDQALILYVRPVLNSDAILFLSRSCLTTESISAAQSPTLTRFLASPFTLRLLALAIPEFTRGDFVALHDLYKTYLHAALLREKSGLITQEFDDIMEQLENLSRNPYLKLSSECEALCESASIIIKVGRRARCDFSHYSLREFMFARSLHKDISRFDANALGRLDLVTAYNVNRMLVPMLTDSLKLLNCSKDRARPVDIIEYQSFLAASGWRRQKGYGLHPSIMRSHDGTPSATFTYSDKNSYETHSNKFRLNDGSTRAISWYDAVAFCLYSGFRLPTSAEARRSDLPKDLLFWCSDWENEAKSYVCAFDTRENLIRGINPDVRLTTTALAIINSE